MKSSINKESIKKMLKNGINKDLIAFELNIPVEDVQKLSESLEAEHKREKIKNELEELRENYKKAYLTSDRDGLDVFENLSKPEKMLIHSTLASTEKILDEMPECTLLDKSNAEKYQRSAGAKAILVELMKIQSYPLSIEIAETFYYLLLSQKMKELNTVSDPDMDKSVKNIRLMIGLKLGMAVKYAAMQTDDIEELKMLKSKISIEMIKEDPIALGSVVSIISDKIARLKKEEIKQEIPKSINDLIEAVADGSLDIEEAKELINKELSKSGTTFGKEQERKQYLIYIADSLMKSASKYYIVDPETTTRKIQELSDGESQNALRIVMTNLIERKEYSRAKEFCQKLLEKESDKSIVRVLANLKKEIENKELANFVLNVINNPIESKKEQQYFEYIKREINLGKIKPSSISLGKAQDGTRNITLADVWDITPNIEF